MKFYLGVLIFITCMIVLALLIYYYQEHRTKYSFTANQRDISAIALAIGVPGFQPGEYRAAPRSPSIIPPHMPPRFAPSAPGFTKDVTDSAARECPTTDLPPYPTKPSSREYVHELVLPDYLSDDSSTSSEQIYYPPKTAAYNVAKRMSMSARRTSAATYKEVRPTMTADVAAFLIAKKMKENFLQRKAANTPINNKTDQVQDSQNKPDSETTPVSENPDTVTNPSYKIENEKIQQKNATPQSSEPASARSSISRIIEEESKRRSASPSIPATVVAFHLKNRNSRSGSPYTALKNDDSCTTKLNNSLSTGKSENSSTSPSPPKRSKKPSLKPAENHPLKSSNNSALKQSENAPSQQGANGCVPKRSESLPMKSSTKTISAKRSESLPAKENTSDRLPLTSSEIAYRSHSPTPLHTVEEEED